MVDVTRISACYHANHRVNPLSAAFLQPANILYIRDQIEKQVRQTFQRPFIIVVTHELVDILYRALENNIGYANNPRLGLQVLNDSIICEQVKMHILSLRQRLRYFKYFINEDRLRVIPYAGLDHPTKGEQVTNGAEGYTLLNPWRKLHKQYWMDVNKFCCPLTSCSYRPQ